MCKLLVSHNIDMDLNNVMQAQALIMNNCNSL